ncbi:hypothetical protein D3C78_1748640 [compost metagenome]
MEMMLEGILSIQNGDHPLLVRRKLESFTAITYHDKVNQKGKGISNSEEIEV